MITPTEIDHIKQQVSIVDLLASRGTQPVSQNGSELAYRSPLRDDHNPSFYVNVQKNRFNDMVVDEHRGDVIRLVQLLDGTSFTEAVDTLQKLAGQLDHPRFFLSGTMSATAAGTDCIREVKLLQNPALLRYVESRGISAAIARMYLREVHYTTNKGQYLYALGLANDRDGYALRNGVGCKRNIGPNDISTIAGTRPDPQTANVFEGMFDFLSALEYFKKPVPTFPTYVLNSVSNLSRSLNQLQKYTHINVYFDRDNAGRDAFGTLQRHNLPVFDRSGLYQGHTDFNQFFTSLTNQAHGQ